MADRSVSDQLTKYLTDVHSIEVQALAQMRAAPDTDAHAIESQAIQLLEAGPGIAGFERLADVFRDHLEETREQQRLVDERLRAHEARPSRFQSTTLAKLTPGHV